MKKIFLILALALTVSVASAWEKRPDEGVVLLAAKHFTPATQQLVTKYLGESFEDDVMYLTMLERSKRAEHSKEIHFLHLDSEFKPLPVDGYDAFNSLEQAMEVVRMRDSRTKTEVTKALRVIINLMCDIHNFSYVRIENHPHSQADFSFQCYAGDIGKRKTKSAIKWSRFWMSYTYWHGGTSGALWAEDMELNSGHKFAEYSQGTLRDWVAQIGAEANKLYSRINPTYEMTRRERNELEELNYEMMVRAGFRLAVLFNELAK